MTLKLWDLTAAKLLRTLRGHQDQVAYIAFLPGGQTAVSSGKDQTLRLWDLATLLELTCADFHTAGINGIALSPDGARVVTAGGDKMLVVAALPISAG